MVKPIAPRLQTCTACYCTEYCGQLKHNGIIILYYNIIILSSFGGLEVACWSLVPKFAGSNLAEAVGFLRVKKSSACLPSEGK